MNKPLTPLPSGPVVVTGQQVGVFLGPLYTLHKAATAIRLARARDATPVFWLQTEDHDFDEIDHVTRITPQGPQVLRLEHDDTDPRVPVSARTLGPSIAAILDDFEAPLAEAPHTASVFGLLRRHYRPDATLDAAFAGVLGEVFEGTGLVLVNPRRPDLAARALEVHRRALLEAGPISDALADGQVHVRPGAPLSFFHPDGADGPRFRLDPHPEGWVLVGRGDVVTTGDVLAAADRDPRCLSTSALLRPVVQDTLLETIAYVGGPGERRYFEQLPPLYAHFGMRLPEFVLRARHRWIEPDVGEALQRLDVSADRTPVDRDAWLARRYGARTDALAADMKARLGAVFETYAEVASDVDPNLARGAARIRSRAEEDVERLCHRLLRAMGSQDKRAVADLARVQDRLHPGGVPQERVYTFVELACRYGIDAVRDRLLGAPESDEVTDLRIGS